jgi:hypothetical protein
LIVLAANCHFRFLQLHKIDSGWFHKRSALNGKEREHSLIHPLPEATKSPALPQRAASAVVLFVGEPGDRQYGEAFTLCLTPE